MAWLMRSALKNIHAITVRKNVVSICANSLTLGNNRPCATVSRFLRFVANKIEGMMNSAFRKPQAIKVQLAPCQKPLTINMIKVFLTRIQFPPLLPHNGMYRYSRNQVDRYICQRRQNSAMSLEKYGKLKFFSSSMPNSRAVPKAISE